MKSIQISVPHDLGRQEAQRRIRGHLGEFRGQSAGLISRFDENWSGDNMEFTAWVLGTPITGRLQVEDQVIHAEVDLPWFLQALAGSVRQAIETNTRLLLEKPCAQKSEIRNTKSEANSN
jgi:hypothetical protein